MQSQHMSHARSSAAGAPSAEERRHDGALNILRAFADGSPIRVEGLEPELIRLTQALAARFAARDREALEAAVSSSMTGSRAQAAVARTFGEVTTAERETEAMAAAIEQMDASIRSISSLAGQADEALTAAASRAKAGADDVNATVASAARAREALTAVVSELEHLVEAAGQIRGIVAAIEAIANQTNLLALNATIEAARAGQAGRGFAVVAQEVKSLAGQTAKSTVDIRTRIARLEEAVAAIARAGAVAREASGAAEDDAASANAKVEDAAAQVSAATTIVGNVAQVLFEQTQAVRELAGSVCRAAESSKRAKTFIDEAVREVDSSEKVIGEQFATLEARGAANYVLYRAKADHLLWKKRLAGLLSELASLDERQLSDHHSCRLGKWWDAQLTGPLASNPAFRAIEEPHRRVHENGRLAARLFNEGNRDGAIRAFEAMERASTEVVARLDQLIAAVEQSASSVAAEGPGRGVA